jgi:hypothetical protein
MTLITNDYEAYSLVKEHLLKQNAKALGENEDCQYRGYTNSKIEEIKEKAKDIANEQEIEWEADKEDIYSHLIAEESPDAMCAVGCLLLDEFYDWELEGKTIEFEGVVLDAVMKSNPLWKITDNSLAMLKELQSIHDHAEVINWELRLSRLNANFNIYKDYEPEQEKE